MITHLLLLTRWEWFKLRRRWMPWILLVILIALPQIGVVSSYFIFRGDINVTVDSSATYTYTTGIGIRWSADNYRANVRRF